MVKIITDSMSDIPKSIVEELDIEVLPLTVRFGINEYRDGVDLSPEEFYHKLVSSEEIPSTSQVPPSDFFDAITKALEEGHDSVIIINGSSEVSGTHQSAILAKEDMKNDNVFVIDSRSLSYGCGMIVVEASKMAKAGESAPNIVKRVLELIPQTEHIFSVYTLKYLHKNGRLSATKMALGTLLNVKPILGILDGKVEPLDKARGTKKMIKQMIEISQNKGLKKGVKIGLGHANNLEGLEMLREEIIKEIDTSEVVISDIGCTIGSHTGPGTLAIFFFKD